MKSSLVISVAFFACAGSGCDSPGRGMVTLDLTTADLAASNLPGDDLSTGDMELPPVSDLSVTDAATDGPSTGDGGGASALNASCAMAKTITDGTMLTGENAAAGVDSRASNCRKGAKGGVLYYAISVPAFGKLTATATPTGTPWDLVIRALDSCAATTCVTFVDDAGVGLPETLSYSNPTAAPLTLLLAVGSYTATVTGTFNLSVTAPVPPPNVRCAMSKVVGNGTTLVGENATQAYDASLTASCDSSAGGGVLYYTATVPPNQFINFKATPTGTPTWDLVIRQLTGCGATSCAYSETSSGAPTTSSFFNTTTMPVKLVFAVGSLDPAKSGTFDVNVAIASPPANISCGSAKPVVDGTVLPAEDPTAALDDLSGACLFASGGNLYYRTTIPAGHTLTAIATPTANLDVTIRVLDSCGAPDAGITSCLASVDAGSRGSAETIVYSNNGAAALPVVLAVGKYSASSMGTFKLAVAISTTPANTRCAMAKPVVSGTMLPSEDVTAASDDLSAACLGSGGVLYYAANLTTGSTLTVTATPIATLDVTLRILDSCAATSCLASADTGGSGAAETLTFASPTTQQVIIAVGKLGVNDSGTFRLAVTITPPPPPPTNVQCAMATAVTNGSMLAAQNQAGGTVKLNASCLPFATGPVLFYKATIPPGKTLTALGAPTGPAWDLNLRLLGACGAPACLGSADNGAAGVDETLTYKNTGAAPQSVILAVGSLNPMNGGLFDLAITIQ